MEIARLVAKLIWQTMCEVNAYTPTEVREHDGVYYIYLIRDGKKRIEISIKDCG